MFLTTGGVFFLWGLKVASNIINMSNIMLARQHNFRHNGAVLRVTLKSIIPKFSSIMYLTLELGAKRGKT